ASSGMKRYYGLGLGFSFFLLSAGCGPSQPAVATPAQPTIVATAAVDNATYPEPDFTQPSRLFMVSDDGNVVKVGDSDDSFKAAFPRSATKARSLDGDLPLGASPDRWIARGWALDNASRGVGALFYDDRIAVVMSQFDNVDEQEVTAEVS